MYVKETCAPEGYNLNSTIYSVDLTEALSMTVMIKDDPVVTPVYGQIHINKTGETLSGYYSDKNSEIDFILQHGTEIIPVEAKGGEDKSAPSFKRYIVEHKPEHALRFSTRGYRKDGEITNIPLYLARKTRELL